MAGSSATAIMVFANHIGDTPQLSGCGEINPANLAHVQDSAGKN